MQQRECKSIVFFGGKIFLRLAKQNFIKLSASSVLKYVFPDRKNKIYLFGHMTSFENKIKQKNCIFSRLSPFFSKGFPLQNHVFIQGKNNVKCFGKKWA